MTLLSMTGFASQQGTTQLKSGAFDWSWEIKSVNGKSLDLKFKLPWGYESWGAGLKNAAAEFLSRGNVSACLEIKRQNTLDFTINKELLDKLAEESLRVYEAFGGRLEKPTVSELMNVRGVVDNYENQPDEEDLIQLKKDIEKGFSEACLKLKEDRKVEGQKMKDALSAIWKKMKSDAERVAEIAEDLPQRMKIKLEEQLRQWKESADISEDRLAQELVLYVTRADIREEADRLRAHLETAEELLNAKEPVGRRLDFLCQELNREANTTCSKSSDLELTNIGMELKTLIEQFREQVQNIE